MEKKQIRDGRWAREKTSKVRIEGERDQVKTWTSRDEMEKQEVGEERREDLNEE